MMLAQMMDWNDHHEGSDWMWVVVALLVILVVAVTVLLVMHFAAGRNAAPGGEPTDGRQRAEDVLADRFAHGEIDEDEYRRRRAALRE
jgi:putative membrane protein